MRRIEKSMTSSLSDTDSLVTRVGPFGHSDLLVNSWRMIRLHGFAADFFREQSGYGERLVAHELGVDAEARAAHE